MPDYWARDLPVNAGQNNFDRLRYEYFRDRQVALEGFKAGVVTFREEFTSRDWATGYDFPAVREGRVKRETHPGRDAVGHAGLVLQHRAATQFKDPRVREALGLLFDFEWTNANIMFGAYQRTTSYFENSDMKAVGKPSPEEARAARALPGQGARRGVRRALRAAGQDGTGQDRNLLRRADALLREAGCKRDGNVLRLPDGKPFEVEFLDFSGSLQPHTARSSRT